MTNNNRTFENLRCVVDDLGFSGSDFVKSVQDLYSVYNPDIVEWLAGIYDNKSGGFYYSNSARDNVGYLFAKDDIAAYIADSLTKIKHTDVKVTLGAVLPEGELYKTERIKIQLLGERIDAAVAKVFNLSRDDSLSYFKKRLVFVGGKLCENNSYTPKENDVISVRGLGRFVYLGASGSTKKGRTVIEIDKFV